MGKLAIIVCLIGLLIGSTLGGLALADKGGDPNLGSSTLGAIENEVTHPVWGLQAIKAEIDDPLNGLSEIKDEVASIEGNVTDPVFGLAAIETKVANIETQLADPATGLAEIKAEVAAIEGNITDPVFGLEEIKSEIATIEADLDSVPRMESFSGTLHSNSGGYNYVYWEFPSVAHIGISIQVFGSIGSGDYIQFSGQADGGLVYASPMFTTSNEYYSFEFDADMVTLSALEDGGDGNCGAVYALTATYPQPD